MDRTVQDLIGLDRAGWNWIGLYCSQFWEDSIAQPPDETKQQAQQQIIAVWKAMRSSLRIMFAIGIQIELWIQSIIWTS